MMYIRQTTGKSELVVVRHFVGDNVEIQTSKEVIRQATAVNPKDRPTAAWILEQLKTLVKVHQNHIQNEIDFFSQSLLY